MVSQCQLHLQGKDHLKNKGQHTNPRELESENLSKGAKCLRPQLADIKIVFSFNIVPVQNGSTSIQCNFGS